MLYYLDDKYWPKISNFHIAASFLHPAFSKFIFVQDLTLRKGLLHIAKEYIHILSEEILIDPIPDESNKSNPPKNKKPKINNENESSPNDLFDWFNDYSKEGARELDKLKSTNIGGKLADYEDLETILKPDDDILKFWFKRRKQFPLFLRIARNIFVIPAGSSAIERRFSHFNSLNIITKKRNCLKKETVQDIMFVAENIIFTRKK